MSAGSGPSGLLVGAEGHFLAGPPLAIPVAGAVDDGVVGDGGEPAQETAGRLVGEAVDIAEGAQAGLLHQVFHVGKLARLRTQLVVNQHSQAPAVAFEGARERLLVAAFRLLQQREGGSGRVHTPGTRPSLGTS